MLANSDTATLAVAFWGTGAIAKLGLDKPWKSLRIVCNLDSGACNPDEIERLISLQGVEVRTDWRLHGKVYLTPDNLVMGSSNASSNGLVVEGAKIAGWAEANVQSYDPNLIKHLSDWCEQRFLQAVQISPSQLALAKIAWSARKASAPVGGHLTSDLLELVKRQPNHHAFKNIKVVQWAKSESHHAEKVFTKALSTDGSLRRTEFYEGWSNEMAIDDWLIDFDVSEENPIFTGYWKVINLDQDSELTFVRKYSSINIPTIGKLKVTENDLTRLATALALSKAVKLGPREKIVQLTELIKVMENSATPANSKAFDRAMFAIYDQAARLGYRPTDFKSMVERAGGISAARQLLAKPSISKGFTRLWELERLDLTVEALVLDPKWRSLFTYDELERARKRLKDVGYIACD